MSITKIKKFHSVRFRLPALLFLLTVLSGAVLYFVEIQFHETEFETVFEKSETLRASRIQAEIDRWIQRNDMDMVQSMLGELAVIPGLKSALFLDATNTVLAADRREYIRQPFLFAQLDLPTLDSAQLRAAMNAARLNMQGKAFFTPDRNGLILCFPTTLPLQPGALQTSRGGLLLVSYDFQLQKSAVLSHVQIEFSTYFTGILLITLTLGVCLHFLITRRLEYLETAMTNFAADKAAPGPAPLWLGDEISHLIAHFQEMAGTIHKTMNETRDLYDHAPCGYHSLDKNGVIIQMNATELQWLGYTREEVIGKRRFSDFLTGSSQQLFQQQFPIFTKRGWVKDLEFEMVCRDGSVRPVLLNAIVIRDPEGNYLVSRSTTHDITERKQAEASAAQEQARLKFVFDALSVGVCLHRTQRDGSETRLINDAHLRIAGIQREEDQPATWLRVSHPDDRQKQAALTRQVEAGKINHFSIDKRYVHSDGQIVWVMFSLQRRMLDDGGREDLTTVVDITERKQTEEKISHLAAIVETTDDAVIGKTLDGKIVSWNHGAEEIYGYTAAEIVGRSVFDLIPAEHQKEYDGIMAKLKAGEKIQHLETLRARKDGRIIAVALTICPIKNVAGEVIGASTIARDITARKQMEEGLYFVAQRGWQTGAEGFLNALARFLCEKLEMDYAFVDKTDENREIAETVALYAKGAIVPNMRYALKGTPCENVMGQKLCVYRQGIQQLFPDDALLAQMGAESYIGIPLWDSSGRPIGLIAVMSNKPIPDAAPVTQLLQLVATRAAAELERNRSEETLVKLNAELEQRVQQRTRELTASELRFRTIYNMAPVSIWQEDWTEVIAMIRSLQAKGVTDFPAWFQENPAFVTNALNAVKILDINQWTLDMFKAKDKPDMLASLGTVFATPDTLPGFVGELVALAQGKMIYRTEMALNTVQGDHIQSLLAMSFPPPEDNSGNVLVSVIDITERKQAEKALRQQAAIIDLSPDAIIVRKEDGTIRSWSRGAEIMYGWTKEEAGNRQTHVLFQTQFPQPLEQINEQLLKTGRWSGELVHRAKDGRTVIVQSWWLAQVDAQGRLVEIIESNVDITERKQAEQSLRASEERMRLFFEHQLVGTAITSPEKGWVQVNDKLCQMLGYSRDELMRLTWSEMTYPDDLTPDMAQFERLLKGETEGYTLEKRFVRKDGGIAFTNLAVSCVRRPDRSVDYVLALLEDITDRKRAEADIQKLNEELQQRARELETANQELQRMNKLFIGRELRMVELKEKLKALAKTDTDNEANHTKGNL